MDDVLEIAEKLSQAIANSKRFKELRVAEAAVMADESAVKVVKEREAAFKRLAEKEQKGEPIEPAEKHAFAAAEESLKTNPLLGELYRTQADFHEMLNKVNQLITSALGPKEEPKSDDAAEDTEESAAESAEKSAEK